MQVYGPGVGGGGGGGGGGGVEGFNWKRAMANKFRITFSEGEGSKLIFISCAAGGWIEFYKLYHEAALTLGVYTCACKVTPKATESDIT